MLLVESINYSIIYILFSLDFKSSSLSLYFASSVYLGISDRIRLIMKHFFAMGMA
jgi:hypothetical protein